MYVSIDAGMQCNNLPDIVESATITYNATSLTITISCLTGYYFNDSTITRVIPCGCNNAVPSMMSVSNCTGINVSILVSGHNDSNIYLINNDNDNNS